ncbi:hypothetical protein FACS1894176_04370 [Bacteroidia bacterium]|nr:hypothetical protein FACS1894176_04370 [Bacteroidia bacterium]
MTMIVSTRVKALRIGVDCEEEDKDLLYIYGSDQECLVEKASRDVGRLNSGEFSNLN